MKSLQQRSALVLFRNSGLLSLLLSTSMLALPVLADELMNISDIKGCRAIDGEAERLLCYDTVSDGGIFNEQKLKEVQVETFGSTKQSRDAETKTITESENKTDANTVTKVESKAEPKAEPKAESKPKTGAALSTDRLAVTIVRTQKDANGFYYFKTSEGQVWKQQESGSWNIKAPFEAEIKAGLMGVFFLMREGGKSVRVKRIR